MCFPSFLIQSARSSDYGRPGGEPQSSGKTLVRKPLWDAVAISSLY
jgi:hypothetical protein